MGESRGAYRVLMEKPGGGRPLGRTRRRWGYIIKIVLREVGWHIDWIDLAQEEDGWLAVVRGKRGNKHSGSTKSSEFLEQPRIC